jgi:hypothetical protein
LQPQIFPDHPSAHCVAAARRTRATHPRSKSSVPAPTTMSLNRACRDLVPTFPQRSLPWLLTTAACGSLRSAPDCLPRRAPLHLSYSYAPSYSDGARDTRRVARGNLTPRRSQNRT